MTTTAVSIAKGSDLTVQITGLGDLTGATGYFAVRNTAGTVVIEKSTDDADEGAIIDPATDGEMEFYLVPSDTSGKSLGGYHYDAWIVTATGKHYQVRSVSQFTITDRVVVL